MSRPPAAASASPLHQLDEMEAALDGVTTSAQAARAYAQAAKRADQDPELIMLSLRGLPVCPCPPSSSASRTTEAAFVVAGGPTCMLREVMLPPYPHEEAPAQLYHALDAARKMQARSEYKAAVHELQLVLRVWRQKHMWKLLRDEPHLSLQQGLEENVRRTEERRLRKLYREEQRLKQEAEEAEFARRMAESEGGEGAAEAAAAAATDEAGGEASRSDSERSDDESDSDREDGDASERADQVAEEPAESKAHAHGHGPQHPKHAEADLPEEVLEFPEVTPEEELEFLVFYYNTLGAIYQSAAASASSGGGARIPSAGGDGSGGVRWGRMAVIPCPADDPSIRDMLYGTRQGAQLGDRPPLPGHVRGGSIAPGASGSNHLLTPFVEEEEVGVDSEWGEDILGPLDADSEFIASSPAALANNSQARALVALWQAKRAHDLYVDLKSGESRRAANEARERDLAARKALGGANGSGGGDEEEMDDERSSSDLGGGGSGGGSGASGTGAAPNAAHTTLGHPAFAAINIPNLSLAALQAESKAMGLFGFPIFQSAPGGGGPGGAAAPLAGSASVGAGGQQAQERERNFLFWSTQPILAPLPGHKQGQGQGQGHGDSNKSLSSYGSGHGGAASSSSASHSRSNLGSSPHSLPAPHLIHPYTLCSPADAVTYSNLGACIFHLGNYPLALRCLHVSLQIRTATLQPRDDEYVDVATSLNNLGVVLASLHFFADAHAHFGAAAELLRARLDPVHPRVNVVAGNLTKVAARRQAIDPAPGLLQQLRNLAETKERKEFEAAERRNAKANKKGAKAAAPARAPPPRPGKKDEEKPKEFHEDPRFFQELAPGQAPIVAPKVEGAPPAPLGSAAKAIHSMPLRQWDVQMGEMQKMLLEFGPAKKKTKAPAAGAKGKSKKK